MMIITTTTNTHRLHIDRKRKSALSSFLSLFLLLSRVMIYNATKKRKVEDFDENTRVLISIEKFCSFFALFCKNFFRTKKTRKTFTRERELLSVYTKILMVRRERTTTHSYSILFLSRACCSVVEYFSSRRILFDDERVLMRELRWFF